MGANSKAAKESFTMGWIGGNWPDDMIGDEALDATGAYLDELGRIYCEVTSVCHGQVSFRSCFSRC